MKEFNIFSIKDKLTHKQINEYIKKYYIPNTGIDNRVNLFISENHHLSSDKLYDLSMNYKIFIVEKGDKFNGVLYDQNMADE